MKFPSINGKSFFLININDHELSKFLREKEVVDFWDSEGNHVYYPNKKDPIVIISYNNETMERLVFISTKFF